MQKDKNEFFDKRNKLNNLSGKEWIKLTKSYWVSEKSVEDKIAFKHPAPFLVKDIMKLISFFTKKSQIVIDPFSGSGTTLLACCHLNRKGIGIDLDKKYCSYAKSRIKAHKNFKNQRIVIGDSLEKIEQIKEKFNYCVTSPPYHNILKNNGQGIRVEKDKYRQGSRKGIDYYSEKKMILEIKKTIRIFYYFSKR